VVLHLDTSAAVKLVQQEDGSDALREFLTEVPARVLASSLLVSAEPLRATRRGRPDLLDRARDLLDHVVLLDIGWEVCDRAGLLDPNGMRSLDASRVRADARGGSRGDRHLRRTPPRCRARARTDRPRTGPSLRPANSDQRSPVASEVLAEQLLDALGGVERLLALAPVKDSRRGERGEAPRSTAPLRGSSQRGAAFAISPGSASAQAHAELVELCLEGIGRERPDPVPSESHRAHREHRGARRLRQLSGSVTSVKLSRSIRRASASRETGVSSRSAMIIPSP